MKYLLTLSSLTCFGRYCGHLQDEVFITRIQRYKCGEYIRVRKLWIKYIINIVVHFVGYLYIMFVINLLAPEFYI